MLRRSSDSLLPFFAGILVGVLTSFAVFSGRLATIETKQANDENAIVRMDAGVQAILAKLNSK
jgi:hypothetical protein